MADAVAVALQTKHLCTAIISCRNPKAVKLLLQICKHCVACAMVQRVAPTLESLRSSPQSRGLVTSRKLPANVRNWWNWWNPPKQWKLLASWQKWSHGGLAGSVASSFTIGFASDSQNGKLTNSWSSDPLFGVVLTNTPIGGVLVTAYQTRTPDGGYATADRGVTINHTLLWGEWSSPILPDRLGGGVNPTPVGGDSKYRAKNNK